MTLRFFLPYSEDGFQNVQQDTNKLLDWSETWQMKFNINKCKVMHIGRHNSEQKYYMRGQLLESVKEEKNLGIWDFGYGIWEFGNMSSDMKVSQQCSAWSTHYVKNKIQVEKVQIKFTKMIPEMRNHSYEARLK